MKASLKFSEDQKPPLAKFKIPLNILTFPFQSSISACGDSKDLSLNLTTFFQSGPSLKLVYKPNDSWNPFSLVVKTGIGPFGSPISTPLSISAEFNLLSRGNPTFFLRFSPQFGDFKLKKSAGSESVFKSLESTKSGEKSLDNGYGLVERVNTNTAIHGVFSGVEFGARTVLPIRQRAVVKFNWGVRFPEELRRDVSEGSFGIKNVAFNKIPFLVMNKISIEHVVGEDCKVTKKESADVEKEVEEVCLGVKRQLDVLHVENGMLRRAVEELRASFEAEPARFGRGKGGGDRRSAMECSEEGVNAGIGI